jgi:RNA polymerase sigma-70 factor (family 1)
MLHPTPPTQEIDLSNQMVFQQVFEEYYASLCRYTLKLIKSPDDAKDIISHVFMKIWQQGLTFKDENHLQAFLYRSSKNMAIDFIRKQFRENDRNLQFQEEINQIENSYLQDIIQYEVIRELRRAINLLAPDAKDIIQLSFLEGLTNQEVADHLGLALQTVKNKKLKAMAQLRKQLKPEHFYILMLLASNSSSYDVVSKVTSLSF